MISLLDLAHMRTAQEQAMPDTCIVSRVGRLPDGYGGYTESEEAQPEIACRVKPISENTGPREEKITTFSTCLFTLPHGTEIVTGDLIEFGTHDYRVTEIALPAEWSTAVRVTATRAA